VISILRSPSFAWLKWESLKLAVTGMIVADLQIGVRWAAYAGFISCAEAD